MPKESMHKAAKVSTFVNARVLREKMTKAEILLWDHLREKKLNGFKFRRQHPVSCFVLDFYCHSSKLAIELDGEIHELKDVKLYDQERTKILSDLGIKVIRFKNCEVMDDIEHVKNQILAFLR